MTLLQLENILGDLRAFAQLVPRTFLHVDELMDERRTTVGTEQTELRNNWFYTADGNLYHLRGASATPMLSVTRAKDNLILRHLLDAENNAFDQLVLNHNYRADKAEALAVIGAPETITVDLTQLRLQGSDKEWRYLEISTAKPSMFSKGCEKLNSQERTLAERVYGQGTFFAANMKMLHEANINNTRIFVLNPEYVRSRAAEGPIGRASWLRYFYNVSNFGADGRNINLHYRLRGVVV